MSTGKDRNHAGQHQVSAGEPPSPDHGLLRQEKVGKGFDVETIAEATGLDKGVVAGTASVIARFNGHLVKVAKGLYRKASQADLDAFIPAVVTARAAAKPDDAQMIREQLAGSSLKDLRSDAKDARVAGYSKMRKDELVDAIIEARS